MIKTVRELYKEEDLKLAPYAQKSEYSRGREHQEKESNLRLKFQKDRDRIIHSKAFRRLKDKTQVFIVSDDDHFRDRLTHSLEVAQISRDIARTLGLNEDLSETIALAHDLGHTPFGHLGEEILNKIMLKFNYGFEHNMQSKRIVTVLEKKHPDFNGLNLTYEVLDGLIKHQTAFDNKNQIIIGGTLESQVVNIADEIAYISHDVDDGYRSKLLKFTDLSKNSLFYEAKCLVENKYALKLSKEIFILRIVSELISLMINDLYKNTESNIKKYRIKTVKDIDKNLKIVGFSKKMKSKVKEIREFLLKNLYYNPTVVKKAKTGQIIIEKLFNAFYSNPVLLPKKYFKIIDKNDPLHIIIKDYIAGMTDSYAIQEYNKLYPKKPLGFLNTNITI